MSLANLCAAQGILLPRFLLLFADLIALNTCWDYSKEVDFETTTSREKCIHHDLCQREVTAAMLKQLLKKINKNHVWALVLLTANAHSDAYSQVIRLPVVTVSDVTHFSPTESSMFPGVFGMYDSVNFGLAETNGQASVDIFTGTWNTGDTVIVRVEAQSGFEFRVSPHPDAFVTSFTSHTSFLVDGGSSISSDASIRFENFRGSMPTVDRLNGSVGTIGQWIGAGFNYHVAVPFKFTAFEIEFITAGPGEITADRAYRTFAMDVGAGARNSLADVRLLEIVRIPEPSCCLLLSVGLMVVQSRLLRKR